MSDNGKYIFAGSAVEFVCTCDTCSLVTDSVDLCLIPVPHLPDFCGLSFTISATGRVMWNYIETAGRWLSLTITTPLTAFKRTVSAVSRKLRTVSAKVFSCRKLPVRQCCLRL